MRFIQQIPVGQTSRWFAGAILLVVSMAQLSCQSTSSSQETNPTSLKAQASIRDERKRPDSADWRSANDSGPVELTVTGELSAYEFTVDPALETGAEVWIGLWACGIKMGELRFVQERGKNELKYTEVARWDPVALELLQAYPDPKMRDRDSLLVRYAKGLLEGDAPYAGFPATMPKGIDSALVVRTALRLAVAARVGVDSLSKHWLLALSVAQVRASLPSLVASGWLEPSDTLSLFPPPPVRVVEPLGVVGAVEAGGNFADVLGRFEWNADLGQITVDAQVTYEGRRIESVAMTSLSIGSGEGFLALTGKSKLLAGGAAPVGTCSLVVVVRSERGDSARSVAVFEIKAATAPPQAPVIQLVSPVDGAAFPFDSSRIDVVWKIKSTRSPVDTVLVGDSLATKLNDSTWHAVVPLAPTGKAFLVAVRARNAQGLWGTGSANFTRAKDQAAPVVAWLSSDADTAVESDVTFFVARLRATDPSGIASVTFGGAAPDSVLAGGVYTKRIALGVPGTSIKVAVAVSDSAGNRTEASRQVARKASNSLEIYGLPDTLRLWEDSSKTVEFQTNCPTGSTCAVQATISDTALARIEVGGTVAAPRVVVSGRPDRNGRAVLAVTLSTGSRSSNQTMVIDLKPVNDLPSFSVKSPVVLASPLAQVRIVDWLGSVSSGPSDESGQKLRYAALVDSGANLASGAVSIDNGVLAFAPKGISGTVRLAITAYDDGDSVAPSLNRSRPQALRVKLDAPPTLKVRDTLTGYEDQRTKSDTVFVDDLENPETLTLDWTILDTALLPKANLRVKAIPGGYTFDALTAPDSNGTARIVWTLADPAGNTVRDTSRVIFIPVNDAPVISKAPGLPDTLVVACTTMDTTTQKLYGDIRWEPGASAQTGTVDIQLADSSQAHLFYYEWNMDGIRTLPNGGIRMRLKYDTSIVVQVVVKATDDGGAENGGVNSGTRSVWIRLTNTVKDDDGNIYTYRHMPDGKIWMRSNLYTRPKNGDTTYRCAGSDLWAVGGNSHMEPNCVKRGALYNWGTAMNQPLGCDTSTTCYQNIPVQPRGLCPSGWHVAEREEWSALMVATTDPQIGNETVDSASNLKSASSDWGSKYAGWFERPGVGKYGDFLIPTDNPHLCADRGAGSTNGANFWLPHRPSGLAPVPGGVSFVVDLWRVSSFGYCGMNDPGLGSIRCVRDSLP